MSLISEGLRALVNLMPDSFAGNLMVNALISDPWGGHPKSKLTEVARATAALLRKHSETGDLKWGYTDIAIKVLEDVGDGSLDGFVPRMEPFNLFGASDSTLTMYNVNQTRTWQQMWNESRQLWGQHVREAHFSVVNCGKIRQIHAGLEAVLRDNDSTNRGNPSTFSEQLILISAMNERTNSQEWTFDEVKEKLDAFPIGTVAIFGPGEADHWWPNQIGSDFSKKWSGLADFYFARLFSGRHLYIRGNAPLAELDTRKWISKAGNQCYDEHFQDHPVNVAKMVSIVTNLPVLNRMLGALYEIGILRGLLPSHPPHTTHAVKWIFRHREDKEQEATRNPEFFNWDELDEKERHLCDKLAAFANIQVPRVGDQFTAKQDTLLFNSDMFRTAIATLPAGTTSGPIQGHGFYEDVSGDAWDPPSGIWVEFLAEVQGREMTVFMKITCNDAQLVKPCNQAGTRQGIWDEEEPPAAMLCIEDIKPAEMIQFLREAGIEETASPDVSQHGGGNP